MSELRITPMKDGIAKASGKLATLHVWSEEAGHPSIFLSLTRENLVEMYEMASDLLADNPGPQEPVEKSAWPEGEQRDFRDESRERAQAINMTRRQPL